MASFFAEKIDQNFLQCGICLESFQKPRGLPCLHSFCEECLERWANREKNSRVLLCPNCKKPTQIPPEGVKGFPAHFLVNSLQETVNMEKAKEDYTKKICSKCNKTDIKANVYCCNCKHFLCKSCFDSHKAWEVMKNHRVITIEDLSSGKVTLFESDIQGQFCTEHDEEQKRFYCETCEKPVCRDCIVMKQCCRDHDYITLKEASNIKSNQLQEAMIKCSEKEKQFEEVTKKAERIKAQFSTFADDAKVAMEKSKKEYMLQLENVFSQYERKLIQKQKERGDALDTITNNLQAGLESIKSASEECKTLTETGSYYDITAKYTSVIEILQEASQIHLDDIDDELAIIPTLVPSTCTVGEQWKQSGQLDVSDSQPNPKSETRGPVGIAVTSDFKIVVGFWNIIKVYSKNGSYVSCLQGLPCSGEDVAVTLNDHIIFLGFNPEVCYIYNSQYKIVKQYPVDHSQCHSVLTVDKNGCIVVGLSNKNVVFHDANDGSPKSSFSFHSTINSIAVPSIGELAVVTTKDTLETVDYSGQIIQIFPPPPEVSTWEPSCVCCSKKYEVFVVNKGDPKAIYRYTAGGEYVGCVTTEINDVRGIAISHDDQKLFVTEFSDMLVKIFQRP